MKINLKDNIWIEGFDNKEEVYHFKDELCIVGEELPYLYIGVTSEIPEELAKDPTCYESEIKKQLIKWNNWN